jgi:hypothetical protein
MRSGFVVLAGALFLSSCGDSGYPLAEFYGRSLSFVSAFVTDGYAYDPAVNDHTSVDVTLTSSNQDVYSETMRMESPAGFTFTKAAAGALDRGSGQAEIVATLDGELALYINDATGGPLKFAVDFRPEGQGQNCGSGCVNWMGTFQTSTWINGTAKVVNGNLEIQQFQVNGSGDGLEIVAAPSIVLHSFELAK